MTRVGLRGITTRRLRTVLTALAIVLGVAMVSGSYTLTDTMRGAADSLSSSAYDGTAAVVSAKTAFKADQEDPVRRVLHRVVRVAQRAAHRQRQPRHQPLAGAGGAVPGRRIHRDQRSFRFPAPLPP